MKSKEDDFYADSIQANSPKPMQKFIAITRRLNHGPESEIDTSPTGCQKSTKMARLSRHRMVFGGERRSIRGQIS
jgi:hypothetical protein